MLFLSNAICGIGVAMIWIPQGEYMSLCASEDTKGFYFGYFWVWYMSAQIIGNSVGAIMIKHTMGPSFFITLSFAEAIFICLFVFVKMPVKIRESEDDKESEEEEKPFKENLKYTLKMCVNKNIAWLFF